VSELKTMGVKKSAIVGKGDPVNKHYDESECEEKRKKKKVTVGCRDR